MTLSSHGAVTDTLYNLSENTARVINYHTHMPVHESPKVLKPEVLSLVLFSSSYFFFFLLLLLLTPQHASCGDDACEGWGKMALLPRTCKAHLLSAVLYWPLRMNAPVIQVVLLQCNVHFHDYKKKIVLLLLFKSIHLGHILFVH